MIQNNDTSTNNLTYLYIDDLSKTLFNLKKLVETHAGIDNISIKSKLRRYVYSRAVFAKLAKEVYQISICNSAKFLNTGRAALQISVSKSDYTLLGSWKIIYNEVKSELMGRSRNIKQKLEFLIERGEDMINEIKKLKDTL